jgi:hypothetical protein
MADGSHGYQGALAMHRHRPERISIARDGRIAAIYLFFDKLS